MKGKREQEFLWSEVMIEEYIRFIKGLSLKSIELLEIAAKKEEDFFPPATVDVNHEVKFQHDFAESDSQLELMEEKLEEEGEYSINAYVKFKLEAKSRAKKRIGLRITAVFLVKYESKLPPLEVFLNRFSNHALLLHTWPYFRQYVFDTTARMNLPPLSLDVIKMV